MEYQEDLDIAKENKADNKRLGKQMRRTPERKLDEIFHDEHEKAFQDIDCLKCANCCKTTSPIFRDVDIKRLSKRFRVKPIQFIDQYLRVDEDEDYVLKLAEPCPFLFDDNSCSVYEDRPLACREYPHTDRKKMFQIIPLTLANTEICPAASRIVEAMREI
jgi:hypothetical protein